MIQPAVSIYSSKALVVNNYQKTKSDAYGFQIEMTFRSFVKDYVTIEAPIKFHERREKANQKWQENNF